jgi:hypothetical protein
MRKYGSEYGSSLPKAAELQGFHDFVALVKRRIPPLWCGLPASANPRAS